MMERLVLLLLGILIVSSSAAPPPSYTLLDREHISYVQRGLSYQCAAVYYPFVMMCSEQYDSGTSYADIFTADDVHVTPDVRRVEWSSRQPLEEAQVKALSLGMLSIN